MAQERAADLNRKFWEKAAIEPAWYVVEAIEGEEFTLALTLAAALAAGALGDAKVLHLVDTMTATRRLRVGSMASRREKVIRKISRFGPLLFVRSLMTPELVEALSHMPKARGVLCAKDSARPIVVADAMIEFYRGNVPLGAMIEPTKISVGDVVRVVEGPAAGQLGEVWRVDSGRALRLDTHKFGGSAPLVIEAGHVELVEQCRRRPIKPNVSNHGLRERA
ncbi:transcription termination/antitermination protein NusG [Methylocystis parvus]|uniref:transcription termination/antitermination protein NusG n=1 Tax=Methylocystis parvus TaxID=134 RepID=UPI003C76F388